MTAAVALILTPGPDTAFVLTQGVSAGERGDLADGLRWVSGSDPVGLGAALALDAR